jgi:hypothetical protein
VSNLDQRALPRPSDGDANSSAICDIGAFEVQAPAAPVRPAEVPEADTLLLFGGGLGGLATWLGWQRRRIAARKKSE